MTSDAGIIGSAIVTALNAAASLPEVTATFNWRPLVDLDSISTTAATVIVSPSGRSLDVDTRGSAKKTITLQISVLGRVDGDVDRPDDLSALTDEIELFLSSVAVTDWRFLGFSTDDAAANDVLLVESLDTQDVFQSLTMVTYETRKAL